MLDLGCGDGALLAYLRAHARLHAATASRSTTPTCCACVQRGVNVHPAQPRRRAGACSTTTASTSCCRSTRCSTCATPRRMLRETARVGPHRHRQLPQLRATGPTGCACSAAACR
ncbi:MAG: methionine biosynthesis protein MetW [Comamonadaceae bacterium]|nr:methionine biosynthesis protein MetW [Comamonadaceae bacterium]